MKHLLLYFIIVMLLGTGILVTLWRGQSLPPRPAEVAAEENGELPAKEQPQAKLKEPLARLLLQLIVILAETRIVGAIFTWFGQPAAWRQA